MSTLLTFAAGAVVLLAGCATTPMPLPTSTPTPTETGLDPAFTESPTPLPDGEVPDLGDRELVAVVVTYAGWSPATSEILAAAFVPDIIEAEGTCTVQAVSGSTVVTTSQPAEPDATSTTCGQLALEDPALVSGTWTVTVQYSSPTSAGSSAARSLEIP